MVRLVDEALRGSLFDRPDGLASSSVTVADPAVGTGTFLLGVLRRIPGTIAADEGPGAVPGAIRAAANRLFGFELQFGPFAVAQLRIIAEMQALTRTERNPHPAIPDLHLYVTDTLGNPYVEEDEWIPAAMRPVAQSRREANKVKREQPITVVIGNPPYKEKADGRGGWVEAGSGRQDALLDRWRAPRA
jgi:predicted helicase